MKLGTDKDIISFVNELKHRLKVERDYGLGDKPLEWTPMRKSFNAVLNGFIEMWGLGEDQHMYAKEPDPILEPPFKMNEIVRVKDSCPDERYRGIYGAVYRIHPRGFVMIHNCVHWLDPEHLEKGRVEHVFVPEGS